MRCALLLGAAAAASAQYIPAFLWGNTFSHASKEFLHETSAHDLEQAFGGAAAKAAGIVGEEKKRLVVEARRYKHNAAQRQYKMRIKGNNKEPQQGANMASKNGSK